MFIQYVLCVRCFLGLRACKDQNQRGPLVSFRPPDPADSSPERLSSRSASVRSPVRSVGPSLYLSPGSQKEYADGSHLSSGFLFPALWAKSCASRAPWGSSVGPGSSPPRPWVQHLQLRGSSLTPSSHYFSPPLPQPCCVRPWPAHLSGLRAPQPLSSPRWLTCACFCAPPGILQLTSPGALVISSYSFLFNWLFSLHQTFRSEGPGTMPDLFTIMLTASTIPSIKL